MRSALPRARTPRLLTRAVALAGVATLAVVGLPAVALAADGTASVTATNGLAGVTSASNTASVSISLSTTSLFVYDNTTHAGPTITLSRSGTTGTDTVTTTITSGSGPLASPGQANAFTVTAPLTSANPGAYDVAVSGATVGSPSQVDRCASCYTVLSSAPVVSSVTPTTIARTGTATLTVLGGNFAKGNYPGADSNYACGSCTNPPKLQIRAAGASIPDPGITLSDPATNAGGPIEATSGTIGKVISVSGSAVLGAHDVYVENSDGQHFTLQNALTVDPAMTVSAVAAQSSVAGAAAGTSLGQGSSGGTITVTGTDIPTDVTGSITVGGSGNTNGLTYGFVRDSATQVRFTGVQVASNATALARTITLSSPGEHQTLTNTSFSVSAAPAPSTRTLADSTVSKYGQGATSVHVKLTGTGFVAGTNATGTQLSFAPATGITVVSQSSTTSDATAVITLSGATPVGTVTVTAVNPDGGTAGCSTACTFAVDAAPVITGVSPTSEARGQSSTLTLTGTNLADGSVKTAPTVTVTHATVNGATAAASATSATVGGVLASSTVTGAQDITLVNNDDKGRTTCVGCFTINSLAVTGTSNGSALNDHTVSAVASGNGFDPTATVSLVKTGSGSATVPPIAGVVTSAPVETAPGASDGTSITASYNLAGVDPGTYAFQVTNPGGSPYPGVGQGGLFTVVANAPTLTSVSPSSRGAGAVNQTVVLTGTNFGPHATVTFSNAAVHTDSVTRDSATQITVVLHIDANVAADASGTVTVTNTDTQSAQSGFAVVTGPDLTSVSPTSRGAGAASTTITLSGARGTFPTGANASVTFPGASGVTASGFTLTPGTVVPPAGDALAGTLAVTAGATLGTFDVVLVDTSTGGRDVCTGCFTVHAKPTVTAVSPTSGAVGTSVPVTLTGTGFLAGATVSGTGGVTAAVTSTTPTSVSATLTIPAGATPDSFVDLTVTNADGGFGTLVGGFHLFGKPGAPTIGTATPGNAKATVTWSAPASDGGSPITSYTVTASPGGVTKTVAAPATSADVTGLTNGTSYTFTVKATNAAGDSPASAPSAATTPRTVPGAPTSVSGVPGDRSVTVSWTAPASNGGASLTGYTVTASPGGATATTDGATTSTSVSGLTNGTAYTFVVHATNVAGSGPDSAASASVTPRTKPGAPTAVSASPGNTKATVSWTAPADNGGSAVTSYVVTATPGGATATVSAPTTSTDVNGLTNGTAYTFTVHAVNAAGAGPESSPSNATTPRAVPGAPTGVSATAGDASAVVTWTPPTSNGGSAITAYTVTSSPGGITATVLAPETSATVSGLTNGTAYTFTVHATNAAGDGPESAPSSAVTPVTNPTAPSGVTAVAGNAKATVTWAVPADDGGSPIVSYTVTSAPDGHTSTVAAGTTTTDVTGLTNGTSYTFTVHATNGSGPSAESAPSNAVTPRTVPGAPTAVGATPGNGTALVTWTAPTDDGGAPISGYTVTASPGGLTQDAAGSATSASVSGLTNGTSYTFTVHATNVAGSSAESDPSSAVTPATVPGVPTGVSATPDNASATVSWTAPADNGGAALTGYTVTASPGGTTKTVAPGVVSTSMTGLSNGTPYTFTVHATNSAGSSAESGASAPVTPRTVPGAPTGVTAVPGDRSATVSWTAPADNGGSPVSGYTVTSSPASPGATVTGAGTSVVVTGLANGTPYTFTVHATNVAGSGAESGASTAVTPSTVPGAPTGVSAVAGNSAATVSWTAPVDNGGAPITGYTVTSSPGGVTKSVAGNQSQAVVTGLTNGTSYTFTVVATNVSGSGAASDPSPSITLPTAPAAPTGVTGTRGNGSATLSWTAPSDGGATITSYVVTATPGGASQSVTGSPAPAMMTFTGLTNGTAYTFTVVARNSQGDSPASSASSPITPATTPTAPQSVTALPGDTQVQVSWAAPTTTGGAAITGYSVRLNGGTPVVTSSTARSLVFSHLTNGTSYSATVVALNSVGSSPAGAAAPVTPRFETYTSIARSASPVVYGTAVKISGRLIRSDGAGLPSRHVQIWAKTYPSTSYRLIATVTTSSTGTWSYSHKPTRLTYYGALYVGDYADWDTESNPIGVAVRYAITRVSPTPGTSVRAGTIAFKAKVGPVLTGAPGALLQRRSDGSVVSVASGYVSSTGYLVLSRRLARGTYVLAFRVSSYKGCITTTTSFFTLKVT